MEFLYPFAILPPTLDPLSPHRCNLFRIGIGVNLFYLRFIRYPRLKVLGREGRVTQTEITHIPFGVYHDSRDIVYRCLLEDIHSQTGLSRTCHTDNCRMGCEVFVFKQRENIGRLLCCFVNIFSQIEEPQFFIHLLKCLHPYSL